MTKQEVIDGAWSLLELLEALPDGVKILAIRVESAFDSDRPFRIQLSSGAEAVSERFGYPIKTSVSDGYIFKEIHAQNCEFVQLESAAEIIKAALGADNTKGGGTGCKPIETTPLL